MKMLLQIVIMVTLLFTIGIPAQAWQVEIKNSCKYKIAFAVYGEHLFFTRIDCNVDVEPGEIKSCSLPGAICPRYIKAGYHYSVGNRNDIGTIENSPCYCNSAEIACCWNVRLEAKPYGDRCKLEIN